MDYTNRIHDPLRPHRAARIRRPEHWASADELPEAQQWEDTVQRTLDHLQEAYAEYDISLLIGQGDTQSPAKQNNKPYLRLEKSLLETMAASQEAYAEGKALIDEWLARLQETAVKMSQANEKQIIFGLHLQKDAEGMPAFFPQTDMNTNEDKLNKWLKENSSISVSKERGRTTYEIRTSKGTFRMTIVKRFNYRPAGDLARLARARTLSDVRALMAGMQAEIGRARSDRTSDANQVKAAIAMMERVLQRCKTKINGLQREGTLQNRVNNLVRTRRKEEMEQAVTLQKVLKEQRRTRRIREYNQIRDLFTDLQPSALIRDRWHNDDNDLPANDSHPDMLDATISAEMAALIGIALPTVDVRSAAELLEDHTTQNEAVVDLSVSESTAGTEGGVAGMDISV